jgi:hypothetical protein
VGQRGGSQDRGHAAHLRGGPTLADRLWASGRAATTAGDRRGGTILPDGRHAPCPVARA